MPVSPSSSAQAAREAVAKRLRALRVEAGLTIGELATACGWHHSKTSRIENAVTAPSARDIRRWCTAVAAPRQAEDLIVQSVHAETMYREWRDQTRRGLAELQNGRASLYQSTDLFRIYSSTLVPGLLQTEGYAAAVLRIAAREGLAVDDSAEAARARVDRSRILHEGGGRRFVFVVEETVLHHRLGDTDAMAAQLGHLLSAGALPAVSLGIIPMAATDRTQWPRETFHLFDEALVSVELVSAQVNVVQPSEVAQYARTFEQLRSMAVYGGGARELILRAIATLH
ncbi:helix-turn-helix domain-containing protein [Streptomyces griseoincarnatus]